MYRLLDMQNCPNDFIINSQEPSALLDTEAYAVSAITPDGRLVFVTEHFLPGMTLTGNMVLERRLKNSCLNCGRSSFFLQHQLPIRSMSLIYELREINRWWGTS